MKSRRSLVGKAADLVKSEFKRTLLEVVESSATHSHSLEPTTK